MFTIRKKEAMDNLNKIAYCGLYCGSCEVFIATQNNTIEQLSAKYQIPVDLLKCEGCRSYVVSLFCRNCAMKKCSQQKNIFTCANCNEFPCSVLKAFENDQHLHHKGVIKSLVSLADIGNEKWLLKQQERWTCNKCESAFSWYENQCLNCKNHINGLTR